VFFAWYGFDFHVTNNLHRGASRTDVSRVGFFASLDSQETLNITTIQHQKIQMKKLFSIVALAAFALAGAHAQLVTWNFSGLTAADNAFPREIAKTSLPEGLVSAKLYQGAGVDSSGGAGSRWGGRGFHTVNSFAEALVADTYISVDLKADEGFTLSLTEVGSFMLERSSSGPLFAQWVLFVNGKESEYTLLGDVIDFGELTAVVGGNRYLFDGGIGLSVLSEDFWEGVASAELRLYAWGASGSTGTLYFDGQGSGTATRPNTFTINGTISPIPEPVTWLLLGTGMAFVMAVRCRKSS